MLRLPLASLAFPALRRRPRPQLATFTQAIDGLIAADGRVELGEYCLAKLIALQVIESLAPAAASAIGRVKLAEVEADLAALLSIVAHYGHDDERDAERAYIAAMNEALPNRVAPYAVPADWAAALDRALPLLDRLAPAGKELVVTALVRSISADGRVCLAEAELLRTISAALHCPLPPMLEEG
jgi:hypothetical protein